MAAAGRVITGFSKPYVAKYTATDGAITYSSARVLARGVSVSVEPETSDSNTFYADNQAAETDAGTFTGGTATLTVDGLLADAETFIMGLPEAGTDGWSAYNDKQDIPYVGIGYIVRYMSDGKTTYVPTVLVKTKFQNKSDSANTQEDSIDWQTQELTANIFRGDDADHSWKYIGKDYDTEAEAEAALKTKLGATTTSTTSGS